MANSFQKFLIPAKEFILKTIWADVDFKIVEKQFTHKVNERTVL